MNHNIDCSWTAADTGATVMDPAWVDEVENFIARTESRQDGAAHEASLPCREVALATLNVKDPAAKCSDLHIDALAGGADAACRRPIKADLADYKSWLLEADEVAA